MKTKSLSTALVIMSFVIHSRAQQSGSFTDLRDGHSYATVQIGTQLWMAENMNFKGDSIIALGYNYKDENAKTYGCLYTWETANRVCPDGWKLPSETDWVVLAKFLGGFPTAAGRLKTSNNQYWIHPNIVAPGPVLFDARGGGGATASYGNISFYGLNEFGYWWTSSGKPYNEATYISIAHNDIRLGLSSTNRNMYYSVRCIKK